jgi:peroxiredoxin
VFCRAHAVQLHRARHKFETAGARLVLIGQLTPRHAAHFRRREQIDLPVLADSRRETYQAAGAKVATMGELLGPKVMAKGAAATAKHRVVQGRTIGHPAQLGGAMVIAPGGEVVWSHMSDDASDNATPGEILDAVRSARV